MVGQSESADIFVYELKTKERMITGSSVLFSLFQWKIKMRRVMMARSRTRAKWDIFTSQKRQKTNPRPGQNLVLKIDWTRANFSTK